MPREGQARESGILAKLKDAGSLITGFGTLLLSIISFYYVHAIDREKAEIAAADLRQKALAAITETDPAKRDIAAITLAAYGDTALPAVPGALERFPRESRHARIRHPGRRTVDGCRKRRTA